MLASVMMATSAHVEKEGLYQVLEPKTFNGHFLVVYYVSWHHATD
jgi:hypothetical protein